MTASASQFLALPTCLRARIYDYTGIPNRKTFYMGFHPRNCYGGPGEIDPAWRHNDQYSRSDNPPAVISILTRVCRLVYHEVINILYSHNKYLIRWKDTPNLSRLSNLSQCAVAYLTRLEVHLNITSCIDTRCVALPFDGIDYSGSEEFFVCDADDTLTSTSTHFSSLSTSWKDCVRRLASCIEANRLWLLLTCDVDNPTTAQPIVRPLYWLPRLKDCSIRLGRFPSPALQAIADAVVYEMVHGEAQAIKGSFPFLALPPELRHRILEYTDLVSPTREVHFDAKQRYHLVQHSIARSKDSEIFLYCRQKNFCWDDSICFCRRHHAAASSKNFMDTPDSSPGCVCWTPPLQLFLVSLAFLEDARRVFFSQNRFIVKPFGSILDEVPPVYDRNEASTFLRDVVPAAALPYLRFIEVVFPLFEAHYSRVFPDIVNNMDETLREVVPSLCLPKLTLRLYMPYHKYWDPTNEEVWQELDLDHRKLRRLLTAHLNALCVFKRLRGLRNVFIHFCQPWRCEQYHAPKRSNIWTSDFKYEFEPTEHIGLEQTMEKYINGPGYDSSESRKHHLSSAWLTRCGSGIP